MYYPTVSKGQESGSILEGRSQLRASPEPAIKTLAVNCRLHWVHQFNLLTELLAGGLGFFPMDPAMGQTVSSQSGNSFPLRARSS